MAATNVNPSSIRPLYLLTLLGADKSAPIVGRTKLVKLMFLVQKKVIEELRLGLTENAYDFRPLNYGPFTEEVYDDIMMLKLRNLARIEGTDETIQSFQLTDRGSTLLSTLVTKGTIPRPLFDEVQKVKLTYGRLPLDQLIRRVYQQYPAYTGRSVIRDRYP